MRASSAWAPQRYPSHTPILFRCHLFQSTRVDWKRWHRVGWHQLLAAPPHSDKPPNLGVLFIVAHITLGFKLKPSRLNSKRKKMKCLKKLLFAVALSISLADCGGSNSKLVVNNPAVELKLGATAVYKLPSRKPHQLRHHPRRNHLHASAHLVRMSSRPALGHHRHQDRPLR